MTKQTQASIIFNALVIFPLLIITIITTILLLLLLLCWQILLFFCFLLLLLLCFLLLLLSLLSLLCPPGPCLYPSWLEVLLMLTPSQPILPSHGV